MIRNAIIEALGLLLISFYVEHLHFKGVTQKKFLIKLNQGHLNLLEHNEIIFQNRLNNLLRAYFVRIQQIGYH